MEDKDKFVINLTKKDKIYISIIFVLVCACFVLAIVLPRPYKIVEVEKPVYETAYQKVYDTNNVYLISTTSSLYNDEVKGYDDGNNFYGLAYSKNYIDTGDLLNIKVSVKVNEAGVENVKTITLDRVSASLIVKNANISAFGVNIEITSSIMQTINTYFVKMLGENKSNPLDYYLFEISFKSAVVNTVVAYISE